MSTDNRDPFAFAGQPEGDAELFAAERDYADHERRYGELASKRTRLTAEETAAWVEENSSIQRRIYATPPATAAGCLIKLRHFIASPAGQGECGVDDDAVAGLEQIIAFLEEHAKRRKRTTPPEGEAKA